ncbi:MAG: hypothetical protein KGP28_08450 [Bdellovibrionales bacterium]|nr:hypothetical protein [Bdellovibrionales bacterium]
MIARTLNGAYVRLDDQLEWIAANPEAAAGNQRFKEIILKSCYSNGGFKKDTYEKKVIPLKIRALKAAGWYEEWLKEGFGRLDRIGTEMRNGSFVNQTFTLFEVMEKEGGGRNELALVRYLAPLALIHNSGSGEALEKIEKFPAKILKQVENELIASRPEARFWLEGNWDSARLDRLKKAFPQVHGIIVKECGELEKNQKTESVHLMRRSCDPLLANQAKSRNGKSNGGSDGF